MDCFVASAPRNDGSGKSIRLNGENERIDMADTSFDVIIIGAGRGGYVTTIRTAQFGFKTAIGPIPMHGLDGCQ